MNGFEHQAVKRLTKTWKTLDKKDWVFLQDLQNTLQTIRKNNYSVGFAPPCVPDFMYQVQRMQDFYDVKRDLRPISLTLSSSFNFKDSGDKDVKCNIDLSKYAKIGAVIDVLGVYAAGANFKEHKQLHEYFKTTIQHLPLDDFNLLDLSLKVEPPQ